MRGVFLFSDRRTENVQMRESKFNDEVQSEGKLVPLCPLCGNKMMLRFMSRGRTAGKKNIWICTKYSECSKIRWPD